MAKKPLLFEWVHAKLIGHPIREHWLLAHMLLSRLIVFVPIVAVLLGGCEDDSSASGPAGWGGIAKVVTQRVEFRPIVDEIQALGTAHANESVEIQPRVSSLVELIAFSEGQMVRKGELLVELENNEIEAGLVLAQASLSERRSSISIP